MSSFRTLDDVDVTGRRVVLRLDLNVPVEAGKVTDTTRIDRVLPTLHHLLNKKAAVLILAHFDRPKGKVVPEMSLKSVAAALSERLGASVRFVPTDWQADPKVEVAPGQAVLMENTRFHDGEEKNTPELARRFANLGDIYVNDAFSAAHRAHASTEGIAHILPAYAGRAMEAELDALQHALSNPKRPVIAIIGGSKVSSKLELLENLCTKVNALVIGGAMANTFMLAKGLDIGKSLVEKDMLDTARKIMASAQKASCEIILPLDVVVAPKLAAGVESHTYGADAVPYDGMILDVGTLTTDHFNSLIDDAHTLVWNGPLGAFETNPFDAGTNATARHAAARTKQGKLLSVAGGGDTVAALNNAGAANGFTYVSTAGGAFLEWLEGKTLPGVAALSK